MMSLGFINIYIFTFLGEGGVFPAAVGVDYMKLVICVNNNQI
jgi:hypothetical protein